MNGLMQSLRTLRSAIWIHRWWGLMVAVAIGVLGSLYVKQLPERYEAAARVHVDTQTILKPLLQGLAVQPNSDQQVVILGRTLMSRPNMERILSRTRPEWGDLTPEQREQAIDRLLREIQMRAAGQNLYSISYMHTVPSIAQATVQSLLDTFFENNLGGKRRDADQARQFIEDQIKHYEQRLLDAETALKNFKIKNMGVMPNLAQDFVTRAGELQNDLDTANLELRQALKSRDALRLQLASESPTMRTETVDSSRVPARPSELDERIDAQRRRLDEFRTRFTEEHPDVIGARTVLQQLEQQREANRRQGGSAGNVGGTSFSSLSNPTYQQLKVSLANAEAQVASLQARVSGIAANLAKARESARTVPKVEAEFTQLTRDYEVNKRNYETLLTRRESAQISGDLEASGVSAVFKVVDPPRVARQAAFPNHVTMVVIVLVASILAGIGTAAFRDHLRPTFHDLQSLRKAAELPVLGVVSLARDSAAERSERNSGLLFTGGALAYVGGMLGFVVWFWLRQQVQ